MRLGLDAGRFTLDLAAAQGITGVPISAEQLVKDGVDATLVPLLAKDLLVCQIGAFGYNPLSANREVQERQRRILVEAIPLAPETGCRYIVISGGNYHPSGFGAGDRRNFTDEALDEVAGALAPLLDLAERNAVNLSIEPYLKTVVHSPGRFIALHERLKSNHLRVNIDVTSLYNYWDLWDSRKTVEDICTTLAGHYGLVHIKEVALLEGFHIHAGLAPLGHGVTDWVQVLRLVSLYLPDDSWAILEHVQTHEEGCSSLRILRAAAAEAGVTLA